MFAMVFFSIFGKAFYGFARLVVYNGVKRTEKKRVWRREIPLHIAFDDISLTLPPLGKKK